MKPKSVGSVKLALIGLIMLVGVVQVGMARTSNGRTIPGCGAASHCRTTLRACRYSDTTESDGPTVIADLPEGVSSDGRGPYLRDKDGVTRSVVGTDAVVMIHDTTKTVRAFAVNLSKPVPGGGGVPLGTIVSRNPKGVLTHWYLVARLHMAGDTLQNLHDIPVGKTVTAAQMNVGFDLNGRAHILQMGPQSFGLCHGTPGHGTGTSSGTIYRASLTKWVMDLPAGSAGRLFDLEGGPLDKGLFYVRLHYEIGR